MGDAGFTLDERLEKSSYLILRRGIQIRLADDSRFPWLILIPEQAQASELHDLDKDLQRDILDLATRLGEAMKRILRLTRSMSPPLAILFRNSMFTLSQDAMTMTRGQPRSGVSWNPFP